MCEIEWLSYRLHDNMNRCVLPCIQSKPTLILSLRYLELIAAAEKEEDIKAAVVEAVNKCGTHVCTHLRLGGRIIARSTQTFTSAADAKAAGMDFAAKAGLGIAGLFGAHGGMSADS